jgi:hypothetical protein
VFARICVTAPAMCSTGALWAHATGNVGVYDTSNLANRTGGTGIKGFNGRQEKDR